MIKNTLIVDDEKAIVEHIDNYTKMLDQPLPRYLTIEHYDPCELYGCRKYKVVWLGQTSIHKYTVYIDSYAHTVVHWERG